jgi:murein L,D-transpeptidase YcbB/YkuD
MVDLRAWTSEHCGWRVGKLRWAAKVRVAQHHVAAGLNKLGADLPLVPDGSYGPLTPAAVKDFQESHGLDADGKVGPETLAAIDAALLD